MSYLLAIDPHVDNAAVAFFEYGKLTECVTVNTSKLIGCPEMTLGFMVPLREFNVEKNLVIERPWVGKNPKGSITLALTVGKIMGSFIRSGFEVHEAPAWGNDNSWISDMLSQGRRMPTGGQVAKLSIEITKAEYPNFVIDQHLAAAVCMGLWWLRKRKLTNS
jgi:hypothetical protein